MGKGSIRRSGKKKKKRLSIFFYVYRNAKMVRILAVGLRISNTWKKDQEVVCTVNLKFNNLIRKSDTGNFSHCTFQRHWGSVPATPAIAFCGARATSLRVSAKNRHHGAVGLELMLFMSTVLFPSFIELVSTVEKPRLQEGLVREQDTVAQFGPQKEPVRQQIHRMFLLRVKLMHFVNSLHNYIMTRVCASPICFSSIALSIQLFIENYS